MEPRTVATALSVGRIAIGAALVVATRRAAGGWLGRDTVDDPGARIAIRGLGARDLAAGLGVLSATAAGADDAELRRWLLATVIGDVADAAATLAGGREGLAGRGTVVLAAGAAGAGAWAASRL